MELVISIRTVATHEKEYKQLSLSNWKPYVIREYSVGDKLPADSIFLCKNGENLIFKIYRHKPRSLPVLDREISIAVSLFFNPEVSTLKEFTEDLQDFIDINIFTTEIEENWWKKYREFDITLEEKLTTIDIIGK